MTDPLGQSQVIPYLAGLSNKGISFHLISFEKQDRYALHRKEIEALLSNYSIRWHPMIYTAKPPILSTIYDLLRLNKICNRLQRQYNFSIVHCRGYISSLIGIRLKKKYGVKYIFDMRAFYADERVDGGLWPQDKFIYKKVFQYFKRKELEFIKAADHIISLTEKGKKIIDSWLPDQSLSIQVIPCCVDLEKFDRKKISEEKIKSLKQELRIKSDRKVLSYIGSISTWYRPDEMMLFYKQFLKQFPDSVFLFITGESPQAVFSFAEKNAVPLDNIRVVKGMHHEVPALLSISNYSVFFIKGTFSKSGSSPTKMGEIMALGIPLICNSGVGDVESIMNDTGCGVLLNELSDITFDAAINKIRTNNFDSEVLRAGAIKYYSLEKGVELYWEVYKKLINIANNN